MFSETFNEAMEKAAQLPALCRQRISCNTVDDGLLWLPEEDRRCESQLAVFDARSGNRVSEEGLLPDWFVCGRGVLRVRDSSSLRCACPRHVLGSAPVL